MILRGIFLILFLLMAPHTLRLVEEMLGNGQV